MSTPEPEPLPGLDDLVPSRSSTLHLAIRRTIVALDAAEKVSEVDAARLALALTMADVIEKKYLSNRMSTIGNDARVLMDLLTGIVEDADSAVDQGLSDAMAAWSRVVENDRAAT